MAIPHPQLLKYMSRINSILVNNERPPVLHQSFILPCNVFFNKCNKLHMVEIF